MAEIDNAGLRALDGLRVLDISRVLAGPLCAQMLADHGAAVIKVEPPEGDEARRIGPPLDERGECAYFAALNRGKRSIALDLSRPAGRAVLERLLQDTDVLIENFLPGTLARWGVGYEDVRANLWHRQLHIFLYPFYYIEYGIAQLGALQVWANSKRDKAKALRDYKAALALGGSRPLPELFAAAGCKFQFDAATIKPLMELARTELRKL